MIYLVRHGQTEFNLARRHHGHIDSSLTQLGREQGNAQAWPLLLGLTPETP